jgi:hypothetical protein
VSSFPAARQAVAQGGGGSGWKAHRLLEDAALQPEVALGAQDLQRRHQRAAALRADLVPVQLHRHGRAELSKSPQSGCRAGVTHLQREQRAVDLERRRQHLCALLGDAVLAEVQLRQRGVGLRTRSAAWSPRARRSERAYRSPAHEWLVGSVGQTCSESPKAMAPSLARPFHARSSVRSFVLAFIARPSLMPPMPRIVFQDRFTSTSCGRAPGF